MNNIILSEVTELIILTKDRVLAALNENEFQSAILHQNKDRLLHYFYDWSFKHHVHKTFFSHVVNYDNTRYEFSNVYNMFEPAYHQVINQRIGLHESNIITQAPSVQTVFNGRLLLIIPNYAISF